MPDLPLVSIIIPLFNQERFVGQAITSILDQGLDEIEIIIVDDGSTDRSAAIVEEYAMNAGGRIRLIRQPNSGGPAKPRNVGIEHSSGKYIAFLDPDDYWYPDKLKQQLDVLTRFETVAMVFADVHMVDVSGAILATYLKRINYLQRASSHLRKVDEHVYLSSPSFYPFSSAVAAGPSTSSVILRREALFGQSVWFPPELRVGEDMDLWFRFMQKHEVAFIDKPVNAYRQHGASLMHQTAIMLAGSVACHERNFERASASLSPAQCKRYRERIGNLHGDVPFIVEG